MNIIRYFFLKSCADSCIPLNRSGLQNESSKVYSTIVPIS